MCTPMVHVFEAVIKIYGTFREQGLKWLGH
jgi:hypothetical protein